MAIQGLLHRKSQMGKAPLHWYKVGYSILIDEREYPREIQVRAYDMNDASNQLTEIMADTPFVLKGIYQGS